MLRNILEELLVFALPFALFAVFLTVARRNPLERDEWEPQWARLTLAGIFLVVASLFFTGLTAERHPEGYVPPHIENGRVVPGTFQ